MKAGFWLYAPMLIMACRSPGLVGELCVSSECAAPPASDAAVMDSAAACDGGDCAADGCDAADCPVLTGDGGACSGSDCGLDASTPGCDDAGCAVDACVGPECACDGGPCPAAPSCSTGTCRATSDVPRDDPSEIDDGCNAAFPVCPECAGDDDCTRGDRRRCDVSAGRCIECFDASHCGLGEPYCTAGRCDECLDDADCPRFVRCRDGECGLD